MIPYDYFYRSEAQQFSFYRIPRALFTDERFKFISSEAKILYGLMLDRMDLSIKNGWMDKKGRAFIYFTLDSIQEKMGCCRAKVAKMLDELDKDVGLIERVRQGQGKPTKIYIRKFVGNPELQAVHNSDSKTTEKQTSRGRKNRSLEVVKTDSNQTEVNNTEYSHTEYQSIYPEKREDRIDEILIYCNFVKENIEYDILAEQNGRERIDEIVDIIMDAIATSKPTIRIGGDEYPSEVVKSRLLKLNSSHIEYVFDCIDKTTTKVHNIKAYLLTALYNAPATIDHYYATLVNHDLYGSKED